MATEMTTLSDDTLVEQVERCTLPPSSLTHRNHVRLAWCYLKRSTHFETGAARFCESLRRYALAIDKPELYHETITWAYLGLINQRLRTGDPDESFEQFAQRCPELCASGKKLLLEYYDAETLLSERARRTFVLPGRF